MNMYATGVARENATIPSGRRSEACSNVQSPVAVHTNCSQGAGGGDAPLVEGPNARAPPEGVVRKPP